MTQMTSPYKRPRELKLVITLLKRNHLALIRLFFFKCIQQTIELHNFFLNKGLLKVIQVKIIYLFQAFDPLLYQDYYQG